MNFDPYFDLFEFDQFATSTGVPVYKKDLPWINGWCDMRVFVRTGARHDPVGKEGLAHFFEHLPFDGSGKFPTSQDIEDLRKKVFLNQCLHGYTGAEVSCFWAKVACLNYEPAIEAVADLIFNPVLAESEIEREKGVVIMEIRRRINNAPIAEIIKMLRRDAYMDHPYGRFRYAFGWEDAVETITRNDLVSFHEANYHPGNLGIMFVGDIADQEAVDLAERFCEFAPKSLRPAIVRPPLIARWPAPRVPLREYSLKQVLNSEKEVQSFSEISVFRAMPQPDNFRALTILADAIEDQLFRAIRLQLGAAYKVSCSSDTTCDHSSIWIDASVNPAEKDAVGKIIEQVLGEFRQGKHEELFRQMQKIRIDNVSAADYRAQEIAETAVDELTDYGYIEPFKETIRRYQNATHAQALEILNAQMRPEQLFWAIMNP